MGSTVVRNTDPITPKSIINVTAQLTSGKKPEKTFEAMLAGAHAPHATATVATDAAAETTSAAPASPHEEANSEAGSLSLTASSLPCSCRDSGNLAINISFFVRLSGELEQTGNEVQSLFHRAARLVSDIFRQEQGWLGDPIGQFLTATESASTKGAAESTSFFQQILSRANSGLQQISQFLGAAPLPQLASSAPSSGNAMSWFNSGYSTDLASLQLSSARAASANAPVRIPEYNRHGEKLYLISNDEAARIKREAKLEKLISSSRDQSVRFLDAFNKFLDSYTPENEPGASDTTQASQADDAGTSATLI